MGWVLCAHPPSGKINKNLVDINGVTILRQHVGHSKKHLYIQFAYQ